MPNVKPLRDRVLVRRIEEAEQKVGGIIIPDTAKEKPLQAEVMAVGSGRVLDNGQKLELTLKKGDKVLIGKWSGTEVKIDGEELLILKEDEILGVLESICAPQGVWGDGVPPGRGKRVTAKPFCTTPAPCSLRSRARRACASPAVASARRCALEPMQILRLLDQRRR